jgi:hypothetical protein
MRTAIYFIISMLLALNLAAQKFEVGFEGGYGQTSLDIGPSISNAFMNVPAGTLYLGVPFTTNTGRNSMTINSGLYYQQIKNECGAIRFLKVPVGVGFSPGKRMQFPIGFGIYMRYTLSTSGDCYEVNREEAKLRPSFFLDMGLKYLLTDEWLITLRGELNIDIAAFYVYSNEYNYSLNGYAVLLGTRYRIPSKQ